MKIIDLDGDQAIELAETFSLLSDPSRLGIVIACANQTRNVGDIAGHTGLSASLVSHHLRLLKAARVLRGERRGRHVFYSLADDCIREVLGVMIEHLFDHAHHDDH